MLSDELPCTRIPHRPGKCYREMTTVDDPKTTFNKYGAEMPTINSVEDKMFYNDVLGGELIILTLFYRTINYAFTVDGGSFFLSLWSASRKLNVTDPNPGPSPLPCQDRNCLFASLKWKDVESESKVDMTGAEIDLISR